MSWSLNEPTDTTDVGEHDSELLVCVSCGQYWACPDIIADGKCIQCAPVTCHRCEHEFPRAATYYYVTADHREMHRYCALCWTVVRDEDEGR